MKYSKLLWLDDSRDPMTRNWLVFSPIPPSEVIWVKNYDQFVDWISINGLPDAICFDHDIGSDKSGYDCAKWLVDYCMDNDLDLPLWNIQSANPVGKDNINSLLIRFKAFRESGQ